MYVWLRSHSESLSIQLHFNSKTHKGQQCPSPRWNLPQNHASFNHKSSPCCVDIVKKVLHNRVSNAQPSRSSSIQPFDKSPHRSTNTVLFRKYTKIFEKTNRRLVSPGCQHANSHVPTLAAHVLT